MKPTTAFGNMEEPSVWPSEHWPPERPIMAGTPQAWDVGSGNPFTAETGYALECTWPIVQAVATNVNYPRCSNNNGDTSDDKETQLAHVQLSSETYEWNSQVDGWQAKDCFSSWMQMTMSTVVKSDSC